MSPGRRDQAGRSLRAIATPFGLLIGEATHFAVQFRQFHILRRRIAAGKSESYRVRKDA